MSTVFDKAMRDALMADAQKLEQMTGDDHTPIFIFDDDETIEEGGTCKSCGTGTYQFLPPENCSCHINAPCSSCLDVQLRCNLCGEYTIE